MSERRQLAFDLGFEPSLSDESFIVAAANAEAADFVARWPRWRNAALLLVGPPASGKSHLARIWAEKSGAEIVSGADLRAENIDALSRLPALVIENLPHGLTDETALFHLYNVLRERRSALLLTSRSPASAWRITLPDLRSRLNTIPSASIDAPDDGLLAQLAMKLFADRQVEVAPDVIAYVLNRMERSPNALARLVEAADRLSLAAKRPITRSVITEALIAMETAAA